MKSASAYCDMLNTTESVSWRPLKYESSTARKAYTYRHNQWQLRCSR